MIIDRELYNNLVWMIEGTINSPYHIPTQENKEWYLNHSWKLAKEYERKVIKKEKEDKIKKIKPRIFYFSFTLSPRWICKVILHSLSSEDYFNLPNSYRLAYGQGATQKEAYDNWLLDLSNEGYE